MPPGEVLRGTTCGRRRRRRAAALALALSSNVIRPFRVQIYSSAASASYGLQTPVTTLHLESCRGLGWGQ